MGQTVLTINGRTYRIGCGDGEETRLRQVAEYLDMRASGVREKFGDIGDDRILMMAAIQIADELWDVREKMAELSNLIANRKGHGSGGGRGRKAERRPQRTEAAPPGTAQTAPTPRRGEEAEPDPQPAPVARSRSKAAVSSPGQSEVEGPREAPDLPAKRDSGDEPPGELAKPVPKAEGGGR